MSIPDSDLATFQGEFTRFMMSYRFVTSELMTKINILADEFTYIHDYSPIEHVRSRLKSPESILRKLQRKEIPATLHDIRTNIVDIAGVRITCSFIQDTYRIADMLTSQSDVTVTEVRDYIAHPKPNGYKSLHLLLELPVFMSDRVEHVPVELQIRTIAMDFWASLEHKIFYRYGGDVPPGLLKELTEAADAANRLDMRMEHLHEQVAQSRTADSAGSGTAAQELFEALAQHHRFPG